MDPARAHALLATLTAANGVTLGPVGAAAYVAPECEAYRALAADTRALAALEPELTELVRAGASPAAVVYAAVLLRALGRDVRPLLAAYRADARPCVVMPGGCGPVSRSLGDAVRWVVGEPPAPPDPRDVLRHELEALARANWFELPSERVLAALAARARLDGRAAQGRWAFSFARLWVADAGELARVRAELEALGQHASPAVRLYATLLLGRLDPAAARAARAPMAGSREALALAPSRWLGRARSTTLGEAVAEVERERRFL